MTRRILFTLTLLCAVAPAQPKEDEEPPQLFHLEIDGKPMPVAVDRPFELPADAGGKTATLRLQPHRVFRFAGVTFQYPRGYAFEADLEDEDVSIWSLDGNDCVIMLQRYNGEKNAGAVHGRFVRGMWTQFGEPKRMGKVGIGTLKGEFLEFALGDTMLRQYVYHFRSGEDSVLLVLQDTADGPEPSDDYKEAERMLRETLRVPGE